MLNVTEYFERIEYLPVRSLATAKNRTCGRSDWRAGGSS